MQYASPFYYLCELNDIVFVKQEESYTSKASFWDNDNIPVHNDDNPKEYQFNGKRIQRGYICTETCTSCKCSIGTKISEG